MESSAGATGLDGVAVSTRKADGVTVHQVDVTTDEAAAALGKARGRYITLCDESIAGASAARRKALAKQIGAAIGNMLPPEGDVLVIGLGNRRITADALGAHVVERMLVTRHLKAAMQTELCGRLRGVCAISPGVLGVTGMETAEMVMGMAERVHPAAVIAIDALAARETARIGATVQITDTGILPGSGVGNHRAGLTRETMGLPVIALGVPMVVYATVIARDALSQLTRELGLGQDEHEEALDALVSQVASPLCDMVVTPREVDDMVGRIAQVLALGINMALQPRLTGGELTLLMYD